VRYVGDITRTGGYCQILVRITDHDNPSSSNYKVRLPDGSETNLPCQSLGFADEDARAWWHNNVKCKERMD
jgi:hypothetical protein